MNDVTAQGKGPHRRPPLRHPDPRVAAAIEELLELAAPGAPNRDLLEEVLTQAVGFADPDIDRGELKILSATLKDFTRAFKVFGQHREARKISVFGSARSPRGSAVYELAHRFAAEAVRQGYMIITGAGPGIMLAGNEGAGAANSFGVSIDLPFESSANEVIAGDPKLVHFKYFFTRKLSFVKESDAIVLFPGGLGTMDEGFESLTLLQTGKCDPLPVVMLDVPGSNFWPSWERYLRENLLRKGLISRSDRNLFTVTTSVEKALAEIQRFYLCYHSLRYVGDLCIVRLKQRPSQALLDRLNGAYRDLLAEGEFALMDGFHPAERSEPEAVRALPRLAFRFVQRGFGRLRRLIDEINLDAEAQAAAPPECPTRPQGGHLALQADPKD